VVFLFLTPLQKGRGIGVRSPLTPPKTKLKRRLG